MPAHHAGIRIETPFEVVNKFLSVPESFQKWAAGLGNGLTHVDGEWFIHTPESTAGIRFTTRNAFGILDHTLTLASGDEIYVPLRVMRDGDQSKVVLTLFLQPNMTALRFEEDAAIGQIRSEPPEKTARSAVR